VERKFPLHSPRIADVVVKRSGKVRRAKLYFLRNLSGKAVRLKERFPSGKATAAEAKAAKAVKRDSKVDAKSAKADSQASAKEPAEIVKEASIVLRDAKMHKSLDFGRAFLVSRWPPADRRGW